MTNGMSIDESLVEDLMTGIEQRLGLLRDRIAAIGADVQILPVSKGQPVEAVVAALRLGLDTLGEDRAKELASKVAALKLYDVDAPTWHFIGRLQSNKIRVVADSVAVWQSVDRLRLGQEIARRAPAATVFAQVNLSSDERKGGCSFGELDDLVSGLDELGLCVDGLMGVGVAGDETLTARGFAALRAAADRLSLRHCSMGMSGDLELAVANGSTMVRVGSDIFGPRS